MKRDNFVNNSMRITAKREHAKKHRVIKEKIIAKKEAYEKTVIRDFILHGNKCALKQEHDNENCLFG